MEPLSCVVSLLSWVGCWRVTLRLVLLVTVLLGETYRPFSIHYPSPLGHLVNP